MHRHFHEPADFQVRPATPQDEGFVDELTRATMRPWVEATWADEANREHYYAINRFCLEGTGIVMRGGERVGRVTIVRSEDGILLDEIHLLPVVQGQGIGAQLIGRLLAEGRAKCQPVSLWVLRVNPAQRLYGRLGFRIVEQTPERYFMRVAPEPAIT